MQGCRACKSKAQAFLPVEEGVAPFLLTREGMFLLPGLNGAQFNSSRQGGGEDEAQSGEARKEADGGVRSGPGSSLGRHRCRGGSTWEGGSGRLSEIVDKANVKLKVANEMIDHIHIIFEGVYQIVLEQGAVGPGKGQREYRQEKGAL